MLVEGYFVLDMAHRATSSYGHIRTLSLLGETSLFEMHATCRINTTMLRFELLETPTKLDPEAKRCPA